jgi:hypothetical protein
VIDRSIGLVLSLSHTHTFSLVSDRKVHDVDCIRSYTIGYHVPLIYFDAVRTGIEWFSVALLVSSLYVLHEHLQDVRAGLFTNLNDPSFLFQMEYMFDMLLANSGNREKES